jgi:hypothetical protein
MRRSFASVLSQAVFNESLPLVNVVLSAAKAFDFAATIASSRLALACQRLLNMLQRKSILRV